MSENQAKTTPKTTHFTCPRLGSVYLSLSADYRGATRERVRSVSDRLDAVSVIGLRALPTHAEQSTDGLPSDALAAGFAYRINQVTLRRFFPIPGRLDEP